MDIAKAIGDLYDYVTSGQGNKHRLLDIAVVNEELAAQIKNVTGCEVGGFAISVDNYGIKHTIRRHGSFDAEAKRGQVAVTKADFELVLKIIFEPNTIRYDHRQYGNSITKRTLIFEKQMGNRYMVALEIRRVTKKHKTNRLVFQTMYIKKAAF